MFEYVPQIYNYYTEENNFYIMREDLLPFGFGGNKLRKNLYYFEKALKNQSNHIITYGTSHSNHARIVANLSAKYNLKCTVISPLNIGDETFNSVINNKLKVRLIKTPIDTVKETIESEIDKSKKQLEKPYFIQGGAHGYLGTKAYVDAFKYIKEYSRAQNIKFDYIFLCSGTGGTQAGLIIGNYLEDYKSEIIGISVARERQRGKSIIKDSIYEYLSESNQGNIELPINFLDEYLVDGYGSYNQEVKYYISYYLKKFGIALDTTYTGKGVYGMHNFLKKNKIYNKNILFIHTGGTPLFFNALEQI